MREKESGIKERERERERYLDRNRINMAKLKGRKRWRYRYETLRRGIREFGLNVGQSEVCRKNEIIPSQGQVRESPRME